MKFLLRFFNNYSTEDKAFLQNLKNIVRFDPINLALYKSAFRHKSVAVEVQKGVKNSNERLEFLGDAVLDIVIAEYLFKHFPYKDEGFLTEMRSKIVNRQMLGDLAVKIGIDKIIETEAKESNTIKTQFKNINGDAFEALVGAIYLDKGFKFAKKYVLNHFILPFIDLAELENRESNFKSKLLEWGQKEDKEVIFEVVEEIGSAHNKKYKIQVVIDAKSFGTGIDFTKKQAEQIAAEQTCISLKID